MSYYYFRTLRRYRIEHSSEPVKRSRRDVDLAGGGGDATKTRYVRKRILFIQSDGISWCVCASASVDTPGLGIKFLYLHLSFYFVFVSLSLSLSFFPSPFFF